MQCPYVFARFFVLALCWFHATSLLALEAQEEYLNHLYQLVKERPLQDGELNLMPDEKVRKAML